MNQAQLMQIAIELNNIINNFSGGDENAENPLKDIEWTTFHSLVLRLKEENGLPVGVEAILLLPLPDLTAGAFTLANLRFGAELDFRGES